MVDTPRYEIRPCAPLAPRCKSVLVAWSLEPLARHTQTVNLFCTPLTLPVGQARGKHYESPGVVRRVCRSDARYTPCLPYACMLFAHNMSSQRLVWNHTFGRAHGLSRRALRAAHGLHARTACPIGGWSRGPHSRSGEGRLCQEPGSRTPLNAQKVEE